MVHEFLFYADGINILNGSVHTIKKNTEALAVPNKENGLEVILIKLSTWSCLEIRIKDKIDVNSFERVLRVHVFGNNLNEQKFLSRRN
jgi:hypothetical protein